MSLPSTPHDALFRALVANPARAGALLAEYLPQEVADLLDPGTQPEAVEGSFVDADAARTQCDALFRVKLKTGHQARIYVLLEHKSSVDAGTPLQILKYMAVTAQVPPLSYGTSQFLLRQRPHAAGVPTLLSARG